MKKLLPLFLVLCMTFAGQAESRSVVQSASSKAVEKKAAQEAAPAVETPKPAKLSAREEKDVKRIETYLNDLKSVSAKFLQVSDSGAIRTGAIAIRRPGRMRVTYDEPDKDFIVADGSFVNIWDDEMQQTTTVPMGDGIADFILREKIALSGDVMVTRFAYYPAKIEVSLVSIKNPNEGELTLIFEDKPLRLRQWRVLDTQGRTTGVNLENAREGVEFPDGTFSYIPPNIGKTGRSTRK